MDTKKAGLLGALAGATALGAGGAAQAANAMQVNSYADLLQPVANPVAALRESNAALAQNRDAVTRIDWHDHYHHHHHAHYPPPWAYHHHHHAYYYPPPPPPPVYYHHHHHHHHSGVFFGAPGFGVVIGN